MVNGGDVGTKVNKCLAAFDLTVAFGVVEAKRWIPTSKQKSKGKKAILPKKISSCAWCDDGTLLLLLLIQRPSR